MLSPEEVTRYSRNITLREIGRDGQERLKNARAVIIGAGGLGSPSSLYLAAAGIGNITIVDADNVDATNLQRQVLYNSGDIRKSKAETAREKLLGLNPFINVKAVNTRIDSENGPQILNGADIILEGSDNFETKFLVNDLAVKMGIPAIIAGISRFDGQVYGFHPEKHGCYRCIFESPPEMLTNCAIEGVLGSMAGVVGTIQATEAIKYIAGTDNIFGTLLLIDTLHMEFRKIRVSRNSSCSACSSR